MITDGPDDDGNMYERPGTVCRLFAYSIVSRVEFVNALTI